MLDEDENDLELVSTEAFARWRCIRGTQFVSQGKVDADDCRSMISQSYLARRGALSLN